MKQINVIKENCIGCGACVAIDPEHFEFDDDGKSSVISNENLESSNLINAIESCPTSAIEMVETDTETTPTETAEESCENCDCGECEEETCTCEECDCTECEHNNQEENNEN